MNTNGVIRDCLKKIVLEGENFLNIPHLYYGEVTAVNEAARTCDVTLISGRAGLDVSGVLLMASVPADGLLQVPAIGSTVLIQNTSNAQPYVAMFSKLSKVVVIVNGIEIKVDNANIFMEAGDSTVNFTDGLIKFNSGSNAGLVKVVELTNKINRLENKVNTLIALYNTHIHIGVTTGPGVSGTTPSIETPIIPITQQADIEDKKITH